MNNENNAFAQLGIDGRFLPVLTKLGFTEPTPIQKQAIPVALEGKDILGIAQTGTGKTLAFGIPLIERLGTHGRGLILAPTRELAEQIVKEFEKVKKTFNIEAVAIVGGAAMYAQVKALLRKPRIIVATPGRLADHIRQRNVSLKDIQMVVLDEADRMLDLGFEPQVNEILKDVPKQRQTLLFSATLDKRVSQLATNYMDNPVRIEIARSGTIAAGLTQELYIVAQNDKEALLLDLLSKNKGSTLIFVRTRISAAKLKDHLKNKHFSATEIHSDRSQGQRKRALEGFKQGRYKILVATDVAARGLDIDSIDLVINYDIPEEEDSYVHRIGRTARAGEKGLAITFATPMQGFRVKAIEKYIEQEIPISDHPTIRVDKSFSAKSLIPAKKGRSRSRQGSGSGSGRFGERKSFGKRPAGRGGAPREGRSFSDRGPREGGDRKRTFSDSGKSFGDRDRKKSFGDRGRAPREDGDQKRSFSDSGKSFGDRDKKKSFGNRSRAPHEGSDQKRSFSDSRKPFGDRDKKKSFGDRGPREGGERKRSFSDSGRSFGDRDQKKTFGDRPPREGRSFGGGERKKRPFENRDKGPRSSGRPASRNGASSFEKKKPFDRDAYYKSKKKSSGESGAAKPAARGYQGDAPYKKREKPAGGGETGGFYSSAPRGGKPGKSADKKKGFGEGFYAKKKPAKSGGKPFKFKSKRK